MITVLEHIDGLCRKKKYAIIIQLADMNKVYNIPNQRSAVFNFMEDAVISVSIYLKEWFEPWECVIQNIDNLNKIERPLTHKAISQTSQ